MSPRGHSVAKSHDFVVRLMVFGGGKGERVESQLLKSCDCVRILAFFSQCVFGPHGCK